ncbi:MAG: alpha/beta hydrolase [Gammaproteobacteria bacterium]|nr:alpha/beta hydrolase [Gammaproteobacteria bacterium]MDH4314236.1 alpha/beta hydrolase [Gammaproteobacteria bacterium]MDH5213267.1 alpha/beta hydrolase [Gammaproteobacteria bacterium]MDH5501869.1 alpha/beta hydrolase [Gammaproteobacteria bacterium]
MNKPPGSEKLAVPGPAGSLQAILETPADNTSRACAVICHPHPLHGGTMHNKIVHTLARAFVHSRIPALRFNFRGVESSEGSYDDGRGELQDALACVDFMRRRSPGLPLWLAGFSFGAAIAIRASVKVETAGLVSIAPAVSRLAAGMEAQPDCPWLIVQGDQDELVDVDETVDWVNRLDPGPELQIFEDTEHFFHGKLVRLRSAVEAFIEAAG